MPKPPDYGGSVPGQIMPCMRKCTGSEGCQAPDRARAIHRTALALSMAVAPLLRGAVDGPVALTAPSVILVYIASASSSRSEAHVDHMRTVSIPGNYSAFNNRLHISRQRDGAAP